MYFCKKKFIVFQIVSISTFFDHTDNMPLSAFKNLSLKKVLLKSLTINGKNTIPNLSKEIGYSIPTVTKFIDELLEEGMIHDFGNNRKANGRRASIYGINPDAFYFLGVVVKRASVRFCLQSADGVNAKIEEKVDYLLENSQESLDQLCDIINGFIDHSQAPRKKIVGVCISLSGFINTREGFIHSFFCFDEKPLASVIESKIGVKTYLENDSRAMTIGEYISGVVQGEQEVLFVDISWGIGIGIVCRGQIYYGKSGISGEFGHTPLFDNEIICQCGKKGCFETEVSGQALERKVKEKLQAGGTSALTQKYDIDSITFDHIIQVINEQADVLAIEVVEEIGEKLGRYLTLLVSIFNPELVIIGGTLSAVYDYMRHPVQTALKRHTVGPLIQDVKIKTSQLGADAGVVGACYLVRGKFFDLM